MSKKFDKLRKEWGDAWYNWMLRLPLKTDILIKKWKRHIITHKWVSFVWINWDDKNLPFIIVPLKDYSLHSNMWKEYDFSAYDIILEYLSILSVFNSNIQIDILHKSFKNTYSDHFNDIEKLKPTYPRYNPPYIYKQEYKINNGLTDIENKILSLFREWNSLDNIFYSYLSFFRIFELLFKDEKKPSANGQQWGDFNKRINDNLEEIKIECIIMNPAAGDYNKFIDNYDYYKIKDPKKNISDYLRKIRDSIAHWIMGKKAINIPNSLNNYLEIQYARSYIKAATFLVVCEKIDTNIFKHIK